MAHSVKMFPLDIPEDVVVKTALVSLEPHSQVGPHSHYTLELSMILSGKGEYRVDHQVYPVQASDIVLFNNTDIHGMRNTGTEPLVNMALEFEPRFVWANPSYLSNRAFLDVFFNRNRRFRHKLDQNNPAFPSLQRQLLDIQAAFEQRSLHHEAIIHARLLSLLADLLQHYDIADPQPRADLRRHAGMDRVLKYISEHYAEPISLASLAEILHMNKTYFSRIFRESNGISPKEYIVKTRIAAAAQQLKDSDRGVLEVAQACGFSSLSNFYNAFKRVTGQSPAQYRLNPLD